MSKKIKISKKKKQLQKEEIKVFKQFKRQKLFRQASFVIAALIVGFWINAFVLNGEMWGRLKTDLLQAQKNKIWEVEKKANLYLEASKAKDGNTLALKAWENMDSLKSLSISFVYNHEWIQIQDIFSNVNGLELSRIENEKGIITIILTFSKPSDIPKWKDLINLYVTKEAKTTQHINIINANFTDSTNTNYKLTTSWIAF